MKRGFLQRLAWIFLPQHARRQCEGLGLHRPVLVDAGMDKRCLNCGLQ